MAPNQRSVLFYENEDVERVKTFEKKGYRTKPVLFVNGHRVPENQAAKARTQQTLLQFLRDVMRLTGSKLGCAEGGCGACTVMISKVDKKTGKLLHLNVNACLMPVLAADGCHVTTVEGIGTVKGGNLHPIQKAMTDMHGSQCGFCTPGIIVSIYSLYANNATVSHIEEHLDGNLCRCTGYRPIWDAARALCEGAEAAVRGPCGTPCRSCPEREDCTQDCNLQEKQEEKKEGRGDVKETCCSTSSKDKMALKDVLVGNKSSWLEQPTEMFPKDLTDLNSPLNIELSKPLMVVDNSEKTGGGTWFKPTSLVQLLELLQQYGGPQGEGFKIVVGNTEVGIEKRFKNAVYPRLIFPSESILSLYDFTHTDTALSIGACTPLSRIQQRCEALGADPALERTVMPIHDMLRWFASTQIRNVACLGGNLVTASPISDMNPMLASMGATLILSSLGKDASVASRRVLVSDFFLRYRVVDIRPTEIVESIDVPILAKVFEYVKPFKQARRREDDISIVTAGMKMRLAIDGEKFIIDHIAMAFGGMAPQTVMATETAKTMIGKEFSKATFVGAAKTLMNELKLPEDVPGGQAAFRMTLVGSFLYKFFLSVIEELSKDLDAIQNDPSSFPSISLPLPATPPLDKEEFSGTFNFLSAPKPSFSGVQSYPQPKVATGLEGKSLPPGRVVKAAESGDAVGIPTPHMSGALHCTGEALYTDDIPIPPGTLQASLILSNRCGSIFESIDVEPALRIEGVYACYTAEDIASLGGKNLLGPIVKDEVIFLPLGEKVRTVGQVLGIVVAETLDLAELGVRMVSINYGEDKEEIIVTVDDAIEAKSFYEMTRHSIEKGDSTAIDSLRSAEDFVGTPKLGDIVKVSGKFHSGAQEHFYLETMSTLAVPSESDTNLTIYSSTQAPTKTQTFCSLCTGTPASNVVVRVKRMGGGFGGKETRSVFVSCAAAVAAKRSSRPVRLTLPRDQDMSTTGTRHAFVSHYRASAEITEEGPKLVSLDIQLYNNAGSGLDLSGPVMDRAIFHVDGCYLFPNMRIMGVCCKTVQAPHTAYRGFGGPQGMAACEHVMDHLAFACNVPGEQLRRLNMYKSGDCTHFGSFIGGPTSGKWNVPSMWDKLHGELDVSKRLAERDKFNSENKWLKRGIAMLPTKFGIAFTAKYMNQGGSLVHLYTDGSVLVSHGGTEMGQGLHTKVCQVAAQAFGIPVERVYINDSSTDKVANTIPTAASMSTDMYGMSTLNACRQILARIAPVREKLGPKATLADVAQAAFMERVDLSAHGFFALDDSRCGFDFNKEKPDDFPAEAPENSWKGRPFNYWTQGAAYTEVEIDVLSGNHRTLRSDVIVDVGSSINPAIDIGQIEGAYTQGMGWSTIEDVVYADDDHTWVRPRGRLFTTGPGTYKIPAFNDAPEIFNVSLMENVDNPFAVHSSKAVGEPPFYLGASVYYAIKDAVLAARQDAGFGNSYIEMRMPATSERIRLYCSDSIANEAKEKMLGDAKSVASYQPQGSY